MTPRTACTGLCSLLLIGLMAAKQDEASEQPRLIPATEAIAATFYQFRAATTDEAIILAHILEGAGIEFAAEGSMREAAYGMVWRTDDGQIVASAFTEPGHEGPFTAQSGQPADPAKDDVPSDWLDRVTQLDFPRHTLMVGKAADFYWAGNGGYWVRWRQGEPQDAHDKAHFNRFRDIVGYAWDEPDDHFMRSAVRERTGSHSRGDGPEAKDGRRFAVRRFTPDNSEGTTVTLLHLPERGAATGRWIELVRNDGRGDTFVQSGEFISIVAGGLNLPGDAASLREVYQFVGEIESARIVSEEEYRELEKLGEIEHSPGAPRASASFIRILYTTFLALLLFRIFGAKSSRQ